MEALGSKDFTGPVGTRLSVQASYTLTLSSFLSAFQSANPQFGAVEVGDQLPYVPVHQAERVRGRPLFIQVGTGTISKSTG